MHVILMNDQTVKCILDVTLAYISYSKNIRWTLGQNKYSLCDVAQCCNQFPPSPYIPFSSFLSLFSYLTVPPSSSYISRLSVELHLAWELAYVSNHFLPAPTP